MTANANPRIDIPHMKNAPTPRKGASSASSSRPGKCRPEFLRIRDKIFTRYRRLFRLLARMWAKPRFLSVEETVILQASHIEQSRAQAQPVPGCWGGDLARGAQPSLLPQADIFDLAAHYVFPYRQRTSVHRRQ